MSVAVVVSLGIQPDVPVTRENAELIIVDAVVDYLTVEHQLAVGLVTVYVSVLCSLIWIWGPSNACTMISA